jgi:maleate isomerase
MAARILLGMLTPSSNTTLEPVTMQIVAGLREVSAHFSRFKVTEIALSEQALGQFADDEILRAARLLADAKMDVIGWSGTSASWRGFDSDERLCRRITESTGIPACTSVLALNEIFARTGVHRFGLVTPYRGDVQDAIVRNYRNAGLECVAERHLGLQDNFSFSKVGADDLRRMVREVARADPQAICILCTNLRGAPLVEALEEETGIPVYDSVATVVWKALALTGAGTARVHGYGRLFHDLEATQRS